jgi:hypothetical protein
MGEREELGRRLDLIDSRRASLRRRLEDGYDRIEAALVAGRDVSEWETFWLDLLAQYEDLCDKQRRQAA